MPLYVFDGLIDVPHPWLVNLWPAIADAGVIRHDMLQCGRDPAHPRVHIRAIRWRLELFYQRTDRGGDLVQIPVLVFLGALPQSHRGSSALLDRSRWVVGAGK